MTDVHLITVGCEDTPSGAMLARLEFLRDEDDAGSLRVEFESWQAGAKLYHTLGTLLGTPRQQKFHQEALVEIDAKLTIEAAEIILEEAAAGAADDE